MVLVFLFSLWMRRLEPWRPLWISGLPYYFCLGQTPPFLCAPGGCEHGRGHCILDRWSCVSPFSASLWSWEKRWRIHGIELTQRVGYTLVRDSILLALLALWAGRKVEVLGALDISFFFWSVSIRSDRRRHDAVCEFATKRLFSMSILID